jgi:hypothetical protein
MGRYHQPQDQNQSSNRPEFHDSLLLEFVIFMGLLQISISAYEDREAVYSIGR